MTVRSRPIPGFDLEIVYQPYGPVGGDLLEIIPLRSGKVAMFLGDVSGKGIPASLVVAQAHNYFKNAGDRLEDPVRAVVALNDELVGRIPRQMFITGIYMLLDPAGSAVTLVNCGHTRPLYFRARDGEVGDLDIPGSVLGVLPSRMFSRSVQPLGLRMADDDRLLVYSDGLSEATNPVREQYDENRLAAAFQQFALNPSGKFVDLLARDLRAFQAGTPFPDDLTLVTFRKGASPEGETPRLPDVDLSARAEPLTGLPSGRLSDFWPEGAPTSLVLVDLDGLSGVNEKYGREAGDRVLQRVGEALKGFVKEGALVGRLRGDTFFILLPGKASDEAFEFAENLRRGFRAVDLSPELTSPTLSVGVGTYPRDGIVPEKILARAKLCADLARREGGDRTRRPELHSDIPAIETAAATEMVSPVMAGRSDEIRLIDQVLSESMNGRPRAVLITGGRGLGRSRLLDEAERLSGTYGMARVRLACSPAQSRDPYRIAVRILRVLRAMDPEFHEKVLRLLPLRSWTALRDGFPELVRNVARESDMVFDEEKEFRQILFVTLSLLFTRWSRQKGLCILLENSGACDRATIELFRWLLTSRGFRCAIFFDLADEVAAAQDEKTSSISHFIQDFRYASSLWELKVDPLSDPEVEEFIRINLLRVRPEEAFRDALLTEAGGKPLKMTWRIRSLIRAGKLKAHPLFFQAEITNGRSDGADERAILESVLDADDRDAGEILDLACVAGPVVSVPMLSRATGRNPGHVLDALDRLVKQGVLRSSLEEGCFEFTSDTLWNVRYHSLEPATREKLHGRVAEAQEALFQQGDPAVSPFAISHHFDRGWVVERAKPYKEEGERLARLRFSLEDLNDLRNMDPADELTTVPQFTTIAKESVEVGLSAMKQLSNTVKVARAYPEDSPTLKQAFELLHQGFEKFFKREKGMTIGVLPDRLTLNDQKIPTAVREQAEEYLHGVLKKKNIRTLTLMQGVPQKELFGLVGILAENTDPYEIASREDYWQMRADQAGFSRIGLEPIRYKEQREIDAADVAEAAKALRTKTQELKEIFNAMNAGTEATRVYPPGSAVIQKNVLQLHQRLKSLLQFVPGLTLGLVGDGVVLNGVNADPQQYGAIIREVANFFRSRKLRSVSFTGEIEPKELDAMLEILGRQGVVGEEAVQKKLDDAGVTSIAVGKRAFQYSEYGLVVSGERLRGPLEQAMMLLEADEQFLVHPDTTGQLVSVLEAAAAAKRQDLTCRLTKRYVRLIQSKRVKEEIRVGAARALAEAILGTGPRTRKFVLAPAQDTLTRLFSEEPQGPVLEALAPLFVVLASEALAERNWSGFVDQVEALINQGSRELQDHVRKALDTLDKENRFEELFAAFRDESRRPDAEPAIRLLGERAVPHLVRIIRESASLSLRAEAARLIKEVDPKGWVRLIGSIGPASSADEVMRVLEVVQIALDEPGVAGRILVELASHRDARILKKMLVLAGWLGTDAAPEIVRKALWRPEEELKMEGLRVATKLNLTEVAPAVLDILRRAKTEKLLLAACRFFQVIPSSVATEELIRIATERRGALFGGSFVFPPELRAAAVKALGSYASKRAEQVLKKAANDKDARVSAAARSALERRR